MPSLIDQTALDAALPETEDFGRVLRSLTRIRPTDMTAVDEEVGAPESTAPENRNYDYPELRLYAARSGTVALPWILGAISRVLATAKHPAPRVTAGLVLSFYTLRPDRRDNPVRALKSLLEELTECDINQYYVFHGAPVQGHLDVKLGSFSIGPTPGERLRYQCDRAGSDYFTRYERRHSGELCVSRDPRPVRVFPANDARALGLVLRTNDEVALSYSIADRYFGAVGSAIFDDFLEEFRVAQATAVALGGVYFDQRMLRRPGIFASCISIFLKLGNKGWVAPNFGVMKPSLDRRALEQVGALPSDVMAPIALDGIFAEKLAAFGNMLIRAVEHENDDRIDEAFLHRVIALDSVLGDIDGTTEAVATRGALLLPGAFGKKLRERRGLLKNIYDIRSRYVHNGRPCDQQQFERLKALCPHVARVLFRLTQLAPEQRPKGMDDWHARLDVAYRAFEAGVELAPGELHRIGLRPEG